MSRLHIECEINGDDAEFLCDADESLLDALRDDLHAFTGFLNSYPVPGVVV